MLLDKSKILSDIYHCMFIISSSAVMLIAQSGIGRIESFVNNSSNSNPKPFMLVIL
ncbi:MAG: hypothetical protein Q8S84_00285 [bacterium]|nr:hypothetical protein [bacterium]MDP3380027.1 hypothetical protein [bacterium]